MRLKAPRIPPLTDHELSPEQAVALLPLRARGEVLNIFRTLARDPDALTAFLAWGGYVLSRRNGLSARDREIAILRIGYLCRSGYEWTQHVEIGRNAGLTAADVARIKAGPEADGWTPAESVLLRAADELHKDQFVADATWERLGDHYSEKAQRDLVFTVGQYTQVCMLLNTFGVQLETCATLDPDLDARA